MANISATFFSSFTPTSSGTTPTVFPVESDKAKGCGYYGQSDGLHTVQYSVQNFVGRIVIQGSLEGKPTDDDWFDVDSITGVSPGMTITDVSSFKGNFVWVRAVIESFTAGNINRVQFTHN